MGYNLTQTNPAYELVSDIVVGTATTTVDFTGLNFGKTDDLMLVSDFLNSSTDTWLNILVNGNYTTTNYYEQYVLSTGTLVVSNRSNDSAFNSGSGGSSKSFSKLMFKLTNNGYVVFQSLTERDYGGSSTKLLNYVGTSTFTATSITSLRIASNVASAIGAGSRFQLYKRVAPVVFDYTVSGSAVTSVDITGLTFDKGSEYMLVSTIINTSASGSLYNLYANGNTTDTNYYAQNITADGATVSSGRQNKPYLAYTTNAKSTFSLANLKLTNNGYFVYQDNTLYDLTTLSMLNYYGTSTFTATSITQLTITASVANAIGIGSRFQLIKLR